MMINKRLIGTVPDSKKYIAGNVALQWCALTANIAMMTAVTQLLAALFARTQTGADVDVTAVTAAAALAVRYFCTVGASRMSYLSSRTVKQTLRQQIYEKLLRLGPGYNRQVSTSEIVQVAVEGVDQLETYFGAYLPQFFYSDAGAAHPVCRALLCQRSGSSGPADLRAAHSHCHCGGADLGQKAAVAVTGGSTRRWATPFWKTCRVSPP